MKTKIGILIAAITFAVLLVFVLPIALLMPSDPTEGWQFAILIAGPLVAMLVAILADLCFLKKAESLATWRAAWVRFKGY